MLAEEMRKLAEDPYKKKIMRERNKLLRRIRKYAACGYFVYEYTSTICNENKAYFKEQGFDIHVSYQGNGNYWTTIKW